MSKPRNKVRGRQVSCNNSDVDKLLDELLADDPRLQLARREAKRSESADNDISDEAVQRYRKELRQKLR